MFPYDPRFSFSPPKELLRPLCAAPGCGRSASVKFDTPYCRQRHRDYDAQQVAQDLKRLEGNARDAARSSEIKARATENCAAAVVPLRQLQDDSERRTAAALQLLYGAPEPRGTKRARDTEAPLPKMPSTVATLCAVAAVAAPFAVAATRTRPATSTALVALAQTPPTNYLSLGLGVAVPALQLISALRTYF